MRKPKKRKLSYRIIEEPFPKSFPASPRNRCEDNEAVHSPTLSGLDEWKRLADKNGRQWFITTAARECDLTGERVRVFILFTHGSITKTD